MLLLAFIAHAILSVAEPGSELRAAPRLNLAVGSPSARSAGGPQIAALLELIIGPIAAREDLLINLRDEKGAFAVRSRRRLA
jgi:hypothetical protein